MITIYFGKHFEVGSYITYLIAVIVTIVLAVVDIILLPFEVIAFLLHRFAEGQWLEEE